MGGKDFSISIAVPQSPDEVFSAVNKVREWWADGIEGSTDGVGSEFVFRYQDMHHSVQRLTESVPGEKVVWRVLESRISFTERKNEWDGTDLVFEIAGKDGGSELTFTHVGLTPALECYEACTSGWSFFVGESLRGLITGGKGEPEHTVGAVGA